MHDQYTTPARAVAPPRPQLEPEALAAGDALLATFLAGRSPQTLRAYRRDLEDVRRYAGVPTVTHPTALLLAHGHGPTNGLALAYRADLSGRGRAVATINRRLAALCPLVKIARTLGLVPWALEGSNVKSQGYRQLLDTLDRQCGPPARCDRAAVPLLFDLRCAAARWSRSMSPTSTSPPASCRSSARARQSASRSRSPIRRAQRWSPGSPSVIRRRARSSSTSTARARGRAAGLKEVQLAPRRARAGGLRRQSRGPRRPCGAHGRR